MAADAADDVAKRQAIDGSSSRKPHSPAAASQSGSDVTSNGNANAKTTASTEKLKGFAAGTASGLTKLTIGQPFDSESRWMAARQVSSDQ